MPMTEEQRARLYTLVAILSLPNFLFCGDRVRSHIVNIVLFPPPTVVAVALWEWIKSGQFASDLLASATRVTAGFVLGAAAGIFFGILTGQFPLFASLFGPIFHILRPIPPIAFVPIVILWLDCPKPEKYFWCFGACSLRCGYPRIWACRK